MITQYIYKGEVVATYNQIDNLPHKLRVPTRHTRADLMEVTLEPSRRKLNIIPDEYIPPSSNLDAMTKAAFIIYNEAANVRKPKFIKWQDGLRYQIKRLLTKAGVIQ